MPCSSPCHAQNPDALALLAERPLDRGADEGEATATAHALAVSAVVDDYEAHEAAAAPAAAARIHRLCLEFLHREGQRSAGSAGDAVNLLLLRAAEMEPRATLPTATADPDDDVAVATEMKANVLMAHGKVAAAQTLLARVATDSPSQRLWLAHARLALFAGVDAAAIDVIFAQAIDAVAEEEVRLGLVLLLDLDWGREQVPEAEGYARRTGVSTGQTVPFLTVTIIVIHLSLCRWTSCGNCA